MSKRRSQPYPRAPWTAELPRRTAPGLLDTFVAAQLRAELAASSNDPRLYHLRDEQGRREVDLLIETAGGRLIGVEVTASAAVTASDARHLAWLRDETGEAFAAGIVLHTGPHVFPLGDRIIAAFLRLVVVADSTTQNWSPAPARPGESVGRGYVPST